MLVALSLPVVIGAGGAAAQQPQDGCLARLPIERVTLNLRDANVQTTLRLLAQQYRVNMVVTEEVKGTVTLDFFRVPAREVFQAVIEAANLRCVVAGEILRVSSDTRVKAEEDQHSKAQEALVKAHEAQLRLEADTRRKIVEAQQAEADLAELTARGPVREETIRLYYQDAEAVAKTVAGILGLAAGTTAPPVPLPQLSQLYVPSPPVEIPSTPAPPQTAPVPAAAPPPDVLAKGLTVQAYKPTNSVFIRFYSRDLERIKKLIRESLDIPLAQIQIAAQMVITTLSALEQVGVQWGGAGVGNVGKATLVGQGFASQNTGGISPFNFNPINPNLALSGLLPISPVTGLPQGGNLVNLPTSLLPTLAGASPAGGLLLGLVANNFNLNLAIQALETQGKARTLAQPKAVTLENFETIISRGLEVPFTSTPSQGVSNVQFRKAELTLKVTPRLITENGEAKIRMKVSFSNDSPDFTQSVAGNPSITTRRQETDVVIREGQRLVIGGVTNDTSSKTIRKVPLFGDIPVLGWLFKSRETNSTGEDLIVILTPTVVTGAGPPPTR